MAANRRKQDDKNLEILREIISQNGNKYCLDCNQRGPTYVNVTIGSFVCSKCSGMLRGLTPPHRVKSISMATFTPEELEFIKSRGNGYCRRVWLGLYDGESVNFADEQSVKDFMSDKYEKKRYYLDAPLNSAASTNGSSSKNKVRTSKSGTSNSSASLISITPQKSSVSSSSAKVVNNLLPAVNEISHKLARPVNHYTHTSSLGNAAIAPPASVTTPVPDFPVDFSTANIYNSSQHNAGFNNNNYSATSVGLSTSPATANTFNNPSAAANDRYAALADLDHALRQQNMMKNLDEVNNPVSKNPFQSSSSELFANKNPFFNGAWGAPPPVSVNPFMPSNNNGNYANSNNPFL